MSDRTAFQAVIFDLDGVLADTEAVCHRGLCDFLAPADLPWDEYVALIGTSWQHSVAWMKQRYGRSESPEELRRLTSEAINRALEAADLVPMDGASELVRALRERHIPLAVASQSSPHWVRRTLERTALAEAFPLVITADQVTHAKPAPDIYLHAAERLRAKPARTIAIEDSAPGLASAVAAGMTVVQLRAAPYAPPPQPGVRHVIASLREFELGWLGGDTLRADDCPILAPTWDNDDDELSDRL